MQNTIWTAEQDAALTAYVDEGKLSFADMAEAINAEFKTTYTRNATIGRSSRLGLSSKRPSHTPATPRPYTWRTRREREEGIVRPPGWAPKQPVAKPANHASHLRCIETTSRDVSFADLDTRTECSWTDSAGAVADFLFCGNPKFTYRRFDVDVTSAYCRKHYEKSIGVGTTSERRATHGVAA